MTDHEAAEERHGRKKERIQLNLLVPLAFGILILLATCVLTVRSLHRRHIHEDAIECIAEVGDMFQSVLKKDSQLLNGLIDSLQRDEKLQNVWLAKDRDALVEYASPIFEDIRSKYRTTHFYFHNVDRTCFLRVHKPSRHGDYIKRSTMAEAVSSGKSAWGIELGPLGTFTLRVVCPWLIEGELAGYIELGEEIEHITPELAEITGAELFFVIDKSYLRRSDWEEGLKMMGRSGDWDRFSDWIVIDSTIQETPSRIGEAMQQHRVRHEKLVFELLLDSRDFLCGFVPLTDFGGSDVGDIIVLNDVTDEQARLERLLVFMTVISGAVSILLVAFFYLYTGRIERRLVDAYNDLIAEMEERRKTQQQVQQKNRFLNNIIESLTHPFYVINVDDYTVDLANSAACKVAMPDKTKCYEISNNSDKPCDSSACTCPLEEARKTKKAVVAEHVHYDMEGNARNVAVNVYPIINEDGNVSQVIEYCIDITDRRRAEDRLIKAKERTEQVNKELVEANERANLMASKAEMANMFKSQFLANMSHEIRTPMNAIIGFSDMLADEDLTDEQNGYISIIRESGRSLLDLINDILDFSKIEAGKLEMEFADCSSFELLNGIESLMKLKADEKGVDFRVIKDDSLPDQIHTDSTRLRQCLINLVSNAIKFTSDGHVHLKSYLYEEDDNTFVKFDVEDTGIGIPPDRQQAIFDSFTQVDGGTSRKYGGTGLGLAITKQLAGLLGGELTLVSEPGKGSVFSLVIPADANTAKRLDRSGYDADESSQPEEGPTMPSKFNGHVLVAEDVLTNQVLIEALLRRLGLEVTIAEDGKEALHKVQHKSFDLILMDIQMPNMDGFEATRVLRENGVTTPVIALTAHAIHGDDEKCFAAGCTDYLSKPIDRKALLEVIAKYLSERETVLSEEADSLKA